MKYYFVIILLICALKSFTQNSVFNASLENSALAGGNNNLPFWFDHNQFGKYSTKSNLQDLTEGQISGIIPLDDKLQLSYGTNIAFLLSEEGNSFDIFQAYAGLSGKTLSIKAGMFTDEKILGGLSSSNGNIVRSLNYRPYPMIRLSTSGFVPFLFAKNWFRFKAEYDEGFLSDKRIVTHPHLHHKSLAFQFLAGKSFRFSVGADHYVFWGGTQPDGNKLPESLKSYFRYITGKKGSPDFLETDRFNVAGNQLGAFLINAEKDFASFLFQINISHPFEDHSGMEFDNLPDNLYSVYIKRKNSGLLIEGFLFEFMYTKKQSGSYHLISGPGKHMRGNDNYFNHGVYGSGFSYHGYSMGTSLFYPLVENDEGVICGFENNRISAFHTGAKGYLSKQIQWKMMLTYSRNFGTFSVPYNSMKEQFYSLAEFTWHNAKLPLLLSTKVGADFGTLTGDQLGLSLGVKWMIK